MGIGHYGSIELLISNIVDGEGWLVLGHNFSLVTGIFALKPLVFSNDTTDFTLMPRKYLRWHVLHPFVQWQATANLFGWTSFIHRWKLSCFDTLLFYGRLQLFEGPHRVDPSQRLSCSQGLLVMSFACHWQFICSAADTHNHFQWPSLLPYDMPHSYIIPQNSLFFGYFTWLYYRSGTYSSQPLCYLILWYSYCTTLALQVYGCGCMVNNHARLVIYSSTYDDSIPNFILFAPYSTREGVVSRD